MSGIVPLPCQDGQREWRGQQMCGQSVRNKQLVNRLQPCSSQLPMAAIGHSGADQVGMGAALRHSPRPCRCERSEQSKAPGVLHGEGLRLRPRCCRIIMICPLAPPPVKRGLALRSRSWTRLRPGRRSERWGPSLRQALRPGLPASPRSPRPRQTPPLTRWRRSNAGVGMTRFRQSSSRLVREPPRPDRPAREVLGLPRHGTAREA